MMLAEAALESSRVFIDGDEAGGGPLLWRLGAAWRFGDGLYETMRVTAGGAVLREALHRARMARGAAACRLPWPGEAAWARAVGAAVGAGAAEGPAEGQGEMVLRVVLVPAGGEAVLVSWASGLGASGLGEEPGWEQGWELWVSAVRHPGLGALGKSVSWQWGRVALREARASGAEEAVVCAGDGEVVEGARTALLWREGERLLTCRREAGGLASTTVEGLREAGVEVAEARAEVGRLMDAQALYVASAVRLVVPVRRLAGEGAARVWVPDVAGAARLRGVLGRGG